MTPAGYSYLIEQLHLEVPPNHHQSFIGKVREVVPLEGKTIFPKKYDPGNELIGHLVFAIKYDGINLCILSEAFKKIPQKEIEDFIISKPTGKYARKIWFLWEFLNEKRLDISDLNQGNYLELLDSEEYFTSPKPETSFRHRILNNLLGNQKFCPVVRQIPSLKEFNLRAECSNLLSCYPKATLNRAVRYLNLKETRSSFAIENIFPNAFKMEQFIQLLSEDKDCVSKENLLEIQNKIVGGKFKNSDYRNNQNYVGQTLPSGKERIHYISPRPEDLPDLMEGLIEANKKLSFIHPIVHAAITSYGFVFLHPFEDGNGRIHRFLIHNILRKETPEGAVLPISATMLKHSDLYDQSLEEFSFPRLKIIRYERNQENQIRVVNKTNHLYKYPDLTEQARILFQFIQISLKEELEPELKFLKAFDAAKEKILHNFDLLGNRVDLFLKLCHQNQGRVVIFRENQCNSVRILTGQLTLGDNLFRLRLAPMWC